MDKVERRDSYHVLSTCFVVFYLAIVATKDKTVGAVINFPEL